LHALRVIDRKTMKPEMISFPDKVFVVSAYSNEEFVTTEFLYRYESLARPDSVYRFDMSTHKSEAVKVKEVPNFKSSDYQTDRIFISAKDGTKIPVSLLYKAGAEPNSKHPLMMVGYGSYGISSDADFSTYPLSYVDQGFVYAIAHVRGGSDMGRDWYDQGRLKNKINTFSDFNAVAEGLIKKGWAAKGHIYAQGGSAGGLLMGAIANMRPDLYRGIVAEVPFVDVVTTMLDDSIPLTTGEYDEWGNPNQKTYYNYMKKYSPYDQVKAQVYPSMLITAGLHDSQVQYWEPMKWASKIRDYNKGDSLVLLHTEMEAGHSGTTGRYQSLKESARVIAFVMGLENGVFGK
jgi:oligopeptidase B